MQRIQMDPKIQLKLNSVMQGTIYLVKKKTFRCSFANCRTICSAIVRGSIFREQDSNNGNFSGKCPLFIPPLLMQMKIKIVK